MIKKALYLLAIAVLSCGLFALIGFSYHVHSTEKIKEVVLQIDKNGTQGFLNEVSLLLDINPSDTLLSFRIDKLNNTDIEQKLMLNPFIEKADCFIGLAGELFIHIKERKPIVRIYEKNNISYYIDEKGNFFPTNANYSPRVIIVNGYLKNIRIDDHNNIYDTVYLNSPLLEAFTLLQDIKEDNFLSAQISQIYYNSKGEWELIPELGNHVVKFGNLRDKEIKFENLNAFYHDLSQQNGWTKYKVINLTFNNQIVCTKK